MQRRPFTRTLIYYYFHTKEEIFLALLQKEYEAWVIDLDAVRMGRRQMSVDEFSDAFAHSLERRSRLLKLMSMNHYDMEANSRMENLADFKKAYGNSLSAVTGCLEKFFPRMTAADRQGFIYAFFPLCLEYILTLLSLISRGRHWSSPIHHMSVYLFMRLPDPWWQSYFKVLSKNKKRRFVDDFIRKSGAFFIRDAERRWG